MKFDWPDGPITPRLVQLVRAGNVPETAAAAVGVSRSAYYRWVADGKGKPRGDPRRDFRDTLLQARALAEIRAVSVIVRGAERDPRLAMAWLAARNPRDWGRRTYSLLKLRGRLLHPVVTIDPRDAAKAEAALERRLTRARSRLPRVVRITPPSGG